MIERFIKDLKQQENKIAYLERYMPSIRRKKDMDDILSIMDGIPE